MVNSNYTGVLFIGDPHLEGRAPGFRRDDYPNAILDKLAWCLEYADNHCLLPAILGDLFDKPRDNPNWVLAKLLTMLDREVIGLYGNHDVHYVPQLTDDDSLSLLVKSDRLRLVSGESPWRGMMNGREVFIAGSSYRQHLPFCYAAPTRSAAPLVIWLAHHDILIPGYDEGRIEPSEIPGVDLVVNGHIHRRLDEVVVGQTRWLTPGNISRRVRSDATRNHVPSVMRLDVLPQGYEISYVEVPHRPFDEVFHEGVADTVPVEGASAFVSGLAQLQARRTGSGAGLLVFLEQNLAQFEPAVSAEIRNLAQEVTIDGSK